MDRRTNGPTEGQMERRMDGWNLRKLYTPLAYFACRDNEITGEDLFQLHVAIPTYAMRPMSLYKPRGSFFHASALQISNFKFLPNKMTTDHKIHKLGRRSSNDHNCQYGSHHYTH